ncbi:polyprenyl synthetase family protein [Pseudobacteriovorax antillogorgiicola]|uniref:Farnesyl diphosphate synthase/geranylgeranyl diphosphate synthase, type II n=1 Tax=Pseudobacteriovorax antillogorgiicola TaxID=1513793 RepID=A0A1Y6C2I3_9BACT|nr:farnesyl diphosphate synthase [Pseudobacteriovorax antillogorgiicola]TCS50696.1 farnesyl diphosphate synthase/geranylgeranyl diphosphate synthase type II [Pseudobacteriovorax antillogorgiicola]SMF40444.1 farnesyl diphosphate synthase/geranylgeranyl diphosphate synthase, type II [Pseudobacteriovorax antillogorgiicola]
MNFPSEIKLFQDYIEVQLRQLAQTRYNSASPVHGACQYALDGRGKRIRPLLTLLASSGLEGKQSAALGPAMAVEMIHTYSLIHDDLPCMDDDDMRRGRPTVHKQFDEPTALLAGDALLTDAFHIALNPDIPHKFQSQIISSLADAGGGRGMVLGQDQDMFWTGKDSFTIENLNFIHSHKTGKLIACACKVGALAAEADDDTANRFYDFGLNLGIAFQVIDDLLDDTEGTGKSKGKDLAQGKLTYLALMTAADARKMAEELTQKAFVNLEPFGDRVKLIRGLGEALLNRSY